MPTFDALLRGAPLTDYKRPRITKSQRVCGRHRVVCVRPNVRVKLGPHGVAPSPDWRKCTAYRQTGLGDTPLGLSLNEGLGGT